MQVTRIIHQNLQSYSKRAFKKNQQAEQTPNHLVSILVFVRDSYLFYASYIC